MSLNDTNKEYHKDYKPFSDFGFDCIIYKDKHVYTDRDLRDDSYKVICNKTSEVGLLPKNYFYSLGVRNVV